ncbi:ubiquitin-like domain-containing protein, partial [Pseudomonas aeruginosa]
AGLAANAATDVDRDQPVTEGLNVDVTTPKIVAINDGGNVTYTSAAAKTVGDLLAERGVTFDSNDRLNVALDAPV